MNETAKDYLKRLQDSEKTHLKVPYELHRWNEYSKGKEDILPPNLTVEEKQHIIDTWNRPDIGYVLEQHKKFILKHVNSKIRRKLIPIPVGFVRSYSPLAWTVKSPTGISVIILNLGILGFVDDLARLFVAYLFNWVGLRSEYEIYSLNELHKRFTYSALHFINDGHYYNKEYHIQLFSDQELVIAYSLGEDIIRFILGHEFAHSALDHISDSKLGVHEDLFEDESIEIPVHKWEQEIDADIWALKLLLKSCKPNDIRYKFTFLAPVLYFSAMHYLDFLCNYSNSVSNESILKELLLSHFSLDHPPSMTRRDLLMDIVGPTATPIERRYMIEASGIFERFIEQFEIAKNN